ncbi:hypothetical protein PILCRDRAFT_825290 [Piloderma croceum F 1598]|uniref:Uncharacterized protein n=1 Tax=Piloderma croceum (strain F 1598) TaxID=765440 RepID=A0A0C3AU94_PILCF|nr:hypothetical protein PILCRDRAFT_825290 [Piloderma croceum F 1598]
MGAEFVNWESSYVGNGLLCLFVSPPRPPLVSLHALGSFDFPPPPPPPSRPSPQLP